MATCSTCGITIGRDGHTDQEIMDAYAGRGEKIVACFSAYDYSTVPPRKTDYCPPHYFAARKDKDESPAGAEGTRTEEEAG
jgi:hypothetical protein